MFIGHLAPAFVAAAVTTRGPKLATFFVAGQLVDWAFFTFCILGIEKMRMDPGATVMIPYDLYYIPYTHSLLGSSLWALGFALLILTWQRNLLGAFLAGLVVLGHWFFDWLAHRPDLTMMGGDEKYGLGLWNHPLIEMPLEIGLTLAAFAFYLSRTRGPVGPPVILLVAMLVLQAVNWFGPEPKEAGLFFYSQALAAYALLTAIAYWVGNNRQFVMRGGLAAPSV